MTDLNSTRHNQNTRARFVRMLGLKSDPFASGSNGYLFSDQESRDLLDIIVNLVHASDKLLVAAGEKGSGKTTLMRQLLDRCENDFRVIRINANARLLPDRLLHETAAAIKARSRQSDKLRNEIHARIREMTSTGRPPLLMIDNAEQLTTDTLELVAELNQEFTGPLRVILFTSPELLPSLHELNTPVEPGSNAHLTWIRPLSIERTADYINQRLEAAGIQIPFILTDVQIARIHKQSGGLPAGINQQARKMFRSGKTIDQIKALLKQEEGNGWRWFSSDYANRIGFYSLVVTVLLIGISIGFLLRSPESGKPGSSGQGQQQADAKQKTVTKVAPVSKPGTRKKKQASLETGTGTGTGTATGAGTTESTKTAPVLKSTGTDKKSGAESSTPVTAKKKAAPATPATSAPVPSQPDISGTDATRLAAFLQHNSRHYTLQLYSASKLKTLKRFVRNHALSKNSVYYRIKYKKRQWYILVYGIFPNKAAASRRLAAMPEEIRANQPRIRRLFYVHRDIRAATLVITRRRKK